MAFVVVESVVVVVLPQPKCSCKGGTLTLIQGKA